MNIIFFANGQFSISPLQSLLNSNHKILAVITNNDKRAGRGNKFTSTPIAEFSTENKLNLIKINQINSSDFIDSLNKFNADIYIVISYKILPECIFSIPKYGTINVHASLLPSYRGAAPIQRSIINNEKEIGLTAFKINSQIDSGNIINQLQINIDDQSNFGDIHDMLSVKSGDFLIKTINLIKENNYFTYNNKKVSYANKIMKNEFKISLKNNSKSIHNLFRGLTPPGPYLLFNNKRIKVFNTYYSNINKHSLSIGEWKVVDEILYIGCQSGVLSSQNIQFQGKTKISIIDFNNMKHNASTYFK